MKLFLVSLFLGIAISSNVLKINLITAERGSGRDSENPQKQEQILGGV